ncbi:MAG: zinc ribbon domain-containing protein [archaeon]|nr:zinc ribbon domain-containing protein [archaeon]
MKFLNGFKLISRSKSFSLNLFSFFILILADIFLATIIFHGLSEQIDQITNEYEYFPYQYRQAFIQSTWVENNIIGKISNSVLDAPIYYEKKKYKKRHPVCQKFDDRIEFIKKNSELVDLFKKLKRLKKTYQNYDAYQKNKLNLAEPTYKEIQNITKTIQENSIVAGTIDFIFEKQRENYIDDIKRYKRTFAFKRTGCGLLFLIPVIVALCFWNNRSNKRERNLSIIISSHFIIVALLPILFEISRLVLEFLPNVLLKNIYEFLISSKLISIWYYIVIALMIATISLVIWFLQNKVFTQKRYLCNRIQKSKCTQCGLKINYEYQYCPNCGNNLLRVCDLCKELTIDGYDHCQNCGK